MEENGERMIALSTKLKELAVLRELGVRELGYDRDVAIYMEGFAVGSSSSAWLAEGFALGLTAWLRLARKGRPACCRKASSCSPWTCDAGLFWMTSGTGMRENNKGREKKSGHDTESESATLRITAARLRNT